MTIIYGTPKAHLFHFLWDELRNISNIIVGPWAVANDYNFVLCDHEKLAGDQLMFTQLGLWKNALTPVN